MTMGRAGDVVLALGLLLLCAPVLLFAILILAMETRSYPVMRAERRVFAQSAVRPFVLRTARSSVQDVAPALAGRFVRRWHLDKLPILINILTGELSLADEGSGPPERTKRVLRALR